MKVSEIIKVVKTWSNERQAQFCEWILLTTPLSIRGILADNSMIDTNKLDAIKLLNEFMHRRQYSIIEFSAGLKNDIIQMIEDDARLYAKQNSDAKTELVGIIRFAYAKTKPA